MKETLYFKTNVLIKNLVGKDLINDDNIAIVELVKNSYDANSEGVLVQFTNFSGDEISIKEKSQLIIADTGDGMDITDIKDKWLNMAYSEKKLVDQENGKYLAGNKGIGRFSCDRLGEALDLLTRKKGGEILHLHIEWKDFEIEGNKNLIIQDIPLEVVSIDEKNAEKISGMKFPQKGTVLVISTFRSIWNRERLLGIKTSLEKFLNPNQLFLRNQFKIELKAPDFLKNDKGKSYTNRVNSEIKNLVFDKLKFKATYIDAAVSENGQTVKFSLFHEGEKVFDLEEKNILYPDLAGTHAVIYYLNPYKKAYFKRQTGIRSIHFGSIFLFLNGFRIAPYGDSGDDWLELDIRKSQGTARRLGSREVVGRIEIMGSEDKFKPISSREGLKRTKEFAQLQDEFAPDVIKKLEKFVVEGLNWDSVPKQLRKEVSLEEGLDWKNTVEQYAESWERKKQRIALSIMTLIGSSPERIIKFWFNPSLLEGVYESRQEEVKNLLSDIEGFDPNKVDANLTKAVSKFKKLIEEKEKEVRAAKSEAADLRVEITQKDEKISKVEGEKETYRAQTLFLQQATSLDVDQLMSYHHQINLDSTILDGQLNKAINLLRGIPKSENILESLEKASLTNKRIAAIAQYASKANFRAGVKKEPTDIPAFIEQYLLRVAADFAAGIKLYVTNMVEESFEINASRIELSILVDNIISNAKKAFATKLTTSIYKISDNKIAISFVDDGRGLSKDLPNVESMFEIGVTTTPGGSGLGLYQVMNIVKKIDGKITAIPHSPKGMEIKLEVTK